MTDLAALLARVEGASGPEYALDREIGLTLGGWSAYVDPKWGDMINGGDGTFPDSAGAIYTSFTESLDAAVALAEQVLPGWWWGIGRYGPDGPIAKLAPSEAGEADDMQRSIICKGATPALALVAAIIRAKMGEAG